MRPPEPILGASTPEVVSSAVLIFNGVVVPYRRTVRGQKRVNRYAAAYHACKEAMGWAWRLQWGGREPLGAGLYIALRAVVTVPADRVWRVDADNLLKSAVDSMLGIVLADDRYVARMEVEKQPARPIVGILPGCRVELSWRDSGGR